MKISWKKIFAAIFFLAALFALDKVFLIPEVRDHFMQPGGMVYYRQRELQIDKLREYASTKPPEMRLTVVLGDSRAFAIGNLPALYTGRKNWKIYNFAGPQAMPAYFDSMTERLFSNARRPSYMILELSQEAFNRNAGILGTTIMAHGIPADWIKRNRTMIPERDMDAYEDTRRFALVGLPFSVRSFYERIKGSLFKAPVKTPFDGLPLAQMEEGFKNVYGPAIEWQNGMMMSIRNAKQSNLSLYNIETSHEVRGLNLMNGAQYVWYGSATTDQLQADTARIAGIYLKHFQVSEEQVFFLQRTLDRAREAKVKTIVFWPQVNPYLEKELVKFPVMSVLKARITKDATDRGATVYDLGSIPETHCNSFYDASHLSIQCFPAITAFLLDRLAEK